MSNPVRGISDLADSVVAVAAAEVTRRAFLRRVGTLALGTALSTALVGTELSGTAIALGTCSSPCGSSPLCGMANCNDDQQCGTLGPNCVRQEYASGVCAPHQFNCWSETYCPGCTANQGTFRCCDCCCPNGPQSAGSCDSCAGVTRYKCICRKHTCGNCPC